MSHSTAQPGLFDAPAEEAAAARERMQAMIDGLRAAALPPWPDVMGGYLECGTFRRAMLLVPADEAEAFWAEFENELVRLDGLWPQF